MPMMCNSKRAGEDSFLCFRSPRPSAHESSESLDVRWLSGLTSPPSEGLAASDLTCSEKLELGLKPRAKSYIGIMEKKMEKKMETTILELYWGYIGIMEKENGHFYIGVILGLYGNYYIGVMLGLYRDNGKENGNYYIGVILGL